MGVSRVDFDGETLVDLTGDTVTPQSLLSGYSAHNKAGELIEGLAVIPTKVSELENDSKFITETGDSSKTTVTFEQAVKRANVNSGDDLSTTFGKLSKFCEDLKPHAFSAPITNLFATVTGNSLDATMGKNLKDLHDANKNEINALNGKLSNWIDITSQCNWNVPPPASVGIYRSFIRYNPSTKQVIGSIYVTGAINNQQLIVTLPSLEGIGANRFEGICGIGITNKPLVIFPRIYGNGIFSSHTMGESTGAHTAYMIDFIAI